MSAHSTTLPRLAPVIVRPFLKWAGAKTRVVPLIRALVPPDATRLVEPFLGSGTVALNLGLPDNLLADLNPDLVLLYRLLIRDRERFIAAAAALFTPRANQAAHFYRLRAEFNSTPPSLRRACLFVFLNRHCFNGLCRYNSMGQFNTPFGRYTAPYFPEAELRTFAASLARARFVQSDFRKVVAEAGAGDFVYCDPPYVRATNVAVCFTAYAAGSFGWRDQQDLAECARAAALRGATVVLSNHDTPEVRRLYRKAREIRPLMVARTISCKVGERQKTAEVLAVFRPVKRSRIRRLAA